MTTHGQSGSRTHKSWSNMVTRCTNANVPEYPYYGGRGIAVCARWRIFEHFIADMGERPAGTSIDRYPDKNGNYEPGNCRWATRAEQSRNTRASKLTLDTAQEILGRIEVGEPLRSIAARLGVDVRTVYDVKDARTWKELDRPRDFDRLVMQRPKRKLGPRKARAM